jgi:class 3 adenylate cyclase
MDCRLNFRALQRPRATWVDGRQGAHNPKVVGSNPTPATIEASGEAPSIELGALLLVTECETAPVPGGLPTGTVTFLFTDLEGSTRLWEDHPAAMKAALARHDEILRDAVEERGGHVVKTTGDGLHAAFAVAPDAVAAALNAQRALVSEEWALPEPLKVRMGLHTGAAELREGDYYGPAVNRAARIAAAAHGGQLVASAATSRATIYRPTWVFSTLGSIDCAISVAQSALRSCCIVT